MASKMFSMDRGKVGVASLKITRSCHYAKNGVLFKNVFSMTCHNCSYSSIEGKRILILVKMTAFVLNRQHQIVLFHQLLLAIYFPRPLT